MQNIPQHVEAPLSQKQKTFSDLLFHFANVHEIYKFLKKKMSILAKLLPKLLIPKEVVS